MVEVLVVNLVVAVDMAAVLEEDMEEQEESLAVVEDTVEVLVENLVVEEDMEAVPEEVVMVDLLVVVQVMGVAAVEAMVEVAEVEAGMVEAQVVGDMGAAP